MSVYVWTPLQMRRFQNNFSWHERGTWRGAAPPAGLESGRQWQGRTNDHKINHFHAWYQIILYVMTYLIISTQFMQIHVCRIVFIISTQGSWLCGEIWCTILFSLMMALFHYLEFFLDDASGANEFVINRYLHTFLFKQSAVVLYLHRVLIAIRRKQNAAFFISQSIPHQG